MNEIKNILTVLRSPHLETDRVLEDRSSDSSLIAKLAANILTKGYESEQDAAVDLYGAHNRHAYQLVKSKLKHRALSTLLLCDIKSSKQSPREATQHQLNRLLVQAELLLLFGARTPAIRLLQKVTKLASEHHIVDVNLKCVRLLRSHYWYEGNKAMYNKCTAELDRLRSLLSTEHHAEELYQRLTIDFVKSNARTRLEIAKKAEAAWNDISKLTESSFTVSTYGFRLKILSLQLNDRHEEVVTECRKAMRFLESNERLYNSSLYSYFLLTLGESLLAQRRYGEMAWPLTLLQSSISQGNPNRILVARLHFLMHINRLELVKATHVITQVLEVSAFAFTPQYPREHWMLYKAYLSVVTKLQQRSTQQRDPAAEADPAWKLPRYNSNASKDKLSFNIALLILEAVKSIMEKDWKKCERIDKSIDNMLYRYLNRKAQFKRTATFLRMIRVMIKEDFNKAVIVKKNKANAAFLAKKQLLDPMEIVSYELLWKVMFKTL